MKVDKAVLGDQMRCAAASGRATEAKPRRWAVLLCFTVAVGLSQTSSAETHSVVARA